MAIGLGRMIGFKFPENFDNPYIARSITEFWRRWHMTLGNWMRNYLYIPLGGNKVKSKYRLYLNLWLVFLASGFWHGAAWTFIFWGIYHGLFLVLERAFLLKFYEKIGKIPSVIITFFIVAIGWVFFRAETFMQAVKFVKKLFSFRSLRNDYIAPSGFVPIFIVACFFAFFLLIPFGKKIQERFFCPNSLGSIQSAGYTILGLVLFFLSLASITSSGFNPFIYFRF